MASFYADYDGKRYSFRYCLKNQFESFLNGNAIDITDIEPPEPGVDLNAEEVNILASPEDMALSRRNMEAGRAGYKLFEAIPEGRTLVDDDTYPCMHTDKHATHLVWETEISDIEEPEDEGSDVDPDMPPVDLDVHEDLAPAPEPEDTPPPMNNGEGSVKAKAMIADAGLNINNIPTKDGGKVTKPDVASFLASN